MRNIVFGFLLTASVGLAQLAVEPPWPFFRGDIVQRLAVAEITLIGTEVKRDMAIAWNADQSQGGTVLTVRVETVLCMGADFQRAATPKRPPTPTEVHVFMPQGEGPMLDDPHPVEQLAIEGKYLLILKKDPESETFVKRLGLDATHPYYRAVAGERGAIQLERSSYKQPEFIEMGVLNSPIPGLTSTRMRLGPYTGWTYPNQDSDAAALTADATAICQAVSPASLDEKIAALERLKSSQDQVLVENANTALKLLRGEPLR